MKANSLEQRIIDISRSHGLSHIGSCISVLPILFEIYLTKNPNDIVIMDNAHAHLAHLVVREKIENLTGIEKILETHGIHCDRKAGCDASGGSLGHALGIAIGMAMANKKRSIYVTVSDGSMMEGSNWEALRIIHDLELDQIHIHCNFNGYTAVSNYNIEYMKDRLMATARNIQIHHTSNGEGFEGLQGHYKVL